MKKIKLKVGQIWQKKGTLGVRTIVCFLPLSSPVAVLYSDIGGERSNITEKSFLYWIDRNKGSKGEVELIGHYDFDKKKARAVK